MNKNEFESIWQGREDREDTDLSKRFHQVIRPIADYQQGSGFTLAGFASDLGVQHNLGRIGARDGPLALRKAIANLAWHFESQLFDAGDVAPQLESSTDPLATAQSIFAETVFDTLNKKQFVIGLGGGHEIGWASYQACRKYLNKYDPQRESIGVINFDAHFDLRKPSPDANWAGSSGTPFYQMAQECAALNKDFHYLCMGINESANTQALFDFADQNGVRYLFDYQCRKGAANPLLSRFISKVDALYVTICLDSLPASIAPGVSAPAGMGIELRFIIDCLHQIRTECDEHIVRWLMADIAELNPKYDVDNRTAKVAARLVYELIKTLQTNALET